MSGDQVGEPGLVQIGEQTGVDRVDGHTQECTDHRRSERIFRINGQVA
jgi:hypothetical protein